MLKYLYCFTILKNSALFIESLTSKDLDAMVSLQPEGWPEILPSIRYYCSSDFCFPLKATADGTIVGTGTAIIYGDSAWLAHIIVHKNYRNTGIGTTITQALIDLISKTPCKTILLIATSLGEPVYKKLGFEVQTQYAFLNGGTLPSLDEHNEIIAFQKPYEHPLTDLDYSVSGEDRKILLREHINDAILYVKQNTLRGFYLPTLGEGVIIADAPEAGIALMKKKFVTHKNFCIPTDNEEGINFLTRHGYQEFRRASRMILGQKLPWNGSRIYSRIGGNLG